MCTKSFPSMPLCFYGDDDGKKYRDAYFDVFEGIWRHGDFAKLTKQGGVVVYGRSDATLNPGGVRIGTADIYRLVDEVMPEISDSIVVGFDKPLPDGTPEVHIILFVKMAEGSELTDELTKKIKKAIFSNCSPRHVPKLTIACPAIPYTASGKKVELAVKKKIHGKEVKNTGALANPEALDFFGSPEVLSQLAKC